MAQPFQAAPALQPPLTSARSSRFRGPLIVCFSAAALLAPVALAQHGTPRVSSGSIGTGSSTPTTGAPQFNDGEPEPNEHLENLRARARAVDRQKRMVEDANRLVVLTTRYRASISEHGRETAEDARLLFDIEKLARSVKDRMKGM